MSSTRWPVRIGLLVALALCPVAQACSSSSSPSGATAGTTVMFDASADFTSTDHFFDFPWPSDLRLSSTGTPDMTGIANPTLSQVFEGLRQIAEQRSGYPMVPVAWFRFTTDLATRLSTDVVAASPTSPILLVDVDPKSPTPGKLLPTIAQTLVQDSYVPDGVLAVGPRPGIVLEPSHQYAYVVLRSALDQYGAPLGVAPALAQALSGSGSDPVSQLYSVLPPALQTAGVPVAQVAAATVFTTGDVVMDLYNLSASAAGRRAASSPPSRSRARP